MRDARLGTNVGRFERRLHVESVSLKWTRRPLFAWSMYRVTRLNCAWEWELERFVERCGCRLAYRVRGSGPAVLMIQGVGVHGDGWRPQIDGLASAYTCLSFDNRGLGGSRPAGAPITVQGMAEDALAMLDAENVSAAHVVGHSLGGLVALRLALAARGRVRSLSLLCTFANGRSAAPLAPRMIWLGLRTKIGTRGMRRRAFLRLVLPPGPIADADAQAARLADLFGHDLADQPPAVAGQMKAMRAADATGRLGELAELPTLVVSAVHDPIAPPAAGRAIRDGIPGSRYVAFDGASHGLPITHAGPINDLLLEHFAAAGG